MKEYNDSLIKEFIEEKQKAMEKEYDSDEAEFISEGFGEIKK